MTGGKKITKEFDDFKENWKTFYPACTQFQNFSDNERSFRMVTAWEKTKKRKMGKKDEEDKTWRRCTDKKDNEIFLIYYEIQMGSVAKQYMRKGFLMYEKMCIGANI